jgi:holo-[acyl-carrier protein] synthase
LIFGIGTDIVQVSRIRDDLDRYGERFAARVLTSSEYEGYCASHKPAHYIAKRFAVKEATAKAFGLGFRDGLSLHHIGVVHNPLGKPELEYHGRALEICREFDIVESHVSIADEGEYAIAFVTLLARPAVPTVRA